MYCTLKKKKTKKDITEITGNKKRLGLNIKAPLLSGQNVTSCYPANNLMGFQTILVIIILNVKLLEQLITTFFPQKPWKIFQVAKKFPTLERLCQLFGQPLFQFRRKSKIENNYQTALFKIRDRTPKCS